MARWDLLFLQQLAGHDQCIMNKPRLIFSSAVSAIITIVYAVVITIWAELSLPLKNWLTNFSCHHWTSKSIFSVLLYAVVTIIIYFVSRDSSENNLRKALILLLVFTVLGTIALTAFFTGHHFKLF